MSMRRRKSGSGSGRVELNAQVFSSWLHRGKPGSILGVYDRSRRIERNTGKSAKRRGRKGRRR